MMLRLQIVMVVVSGLISGCGQVSVFGKTIGEKQPAVQANVEATATPAAVVTPSVQAPPQVALQVYKVKSVTVALTPQAAVKVADDSRFNTDALLAEVKKELQSRKLLDDTDSHATTMEISLDDYAMRRTSNVILFGNIISAGTLSGTMRLRNGEGSELQMRRIDAGAQVSIPANGESTNPLGTLYRQFSVLVANSLDGTKAKPIIGADGHPRAAE